MCVPRLPNGAFLRGLLDPRHYAGEGITMIVEMRTYRTKPGMRARFLEIFRSKSMPAHAAIGMRVLGPKYRNFKPPVTLVIGG